MSFHTRAVHRTVPTFRPRFATPFDVALSSLYAGDEFCELLSSSLLVVVPLAIGSTAGPWFSVTE